ncbi:YigZ family protein [Prevotella sp. oral taxon 475]|uniref:IMPACT family protein n=1 Tax=Prevotella sp. oral taxon 475 TaxID=712471 RepID=UPI001BA95254|nr:YigZ family protein [Prevotella sp. oral taxon 475]QUB47990.1 YigZ family protein [Prevotella sp. oral taxon 475]
MNDEYETIDSIGEGIYSEKRSKFLAFAHPAASVEQVKDLIADYRKKYYDARHVCYAYVLGAERQDFRANDDGEPSSTAGKPILGQINSNELTDILVVVVRYYGGVNLGTGGLISAYRTAAALAIENASKVKKTVEETVVHTFVYPLMNKVMRTAREMGARIVDMHYDNTCEIVLSIARSKAFLLRSKLDKISFEG